MCYNKIVYDNWINKDIEIGHEHLMRYLIVRYFFCRDHKFDEVMKSHRPQVIASLLLHFYIYNFHIAQIGQSIGRTHKK